MEIQELAEKLQQEGVAKGKEEAEKVLAKAKQEREDILASAKKEAEEIVAKAKAEAEKIIEDGKHALALAARDVVLKLQEDLCQILNNLTSQAVEKTLDQPEIIKQLLQNLVDSYKEQLGAHQMSVELSSKVSEELESWLKNELGSEIRKQERLSGFCLQEKDGGKVEVTVDSVREALLPYLRGLAQQMVETQEKNS